MGNSSDLEGRVTTSIQGGVARVSFYHPKANCLSPTVVSDLRAALRECESKNCHQLILSSEGEGAFCAGASFDYLKSISSEEQGSEYFFSIGSLVSEIRNLPAVVIGRVHGKSVGGGIGVLAACDYVIASGNAMVKLSEVSLGLGPYVIGPAVRERIGASCFAALTLDTEWRDANWCLTHNMFSAVFDSTEKLDQEIEKMVVNFKALDVLAVKNLKKLFWGESLDWESELKVLANASAAALIKNRLVDKK